MSAVASPTRTGTNRAAHQSRQPAPGELLFEFYRERDHSGRSASSINHGETYGVEVQFFKRDEFMIGRWFDARLDPTRPAAGADDRVGRREAQVPDGGVEGSLRLRCCGNRSLRPANLFM